MRRKFLPAFVWCTFGVAATALAGEANVEKKTNKPDLGFIENKGQIVDQANRPNTAVRYLLNTPGLNVQLRSNGFSYDAYTTGQNTPLATGLRGIKTDAASIAPLVYDFHRVDITLLGANKDAQIIAGDAAVDYINFVKDGMDIAQIHHYSKVVYRNIYPKIDMEFTTSRQDGKLVEYNFIVHPGGDPSQIRMQYTGANSTMLDDNRVNMDIKPGKLQERIPASYMQAGKEAVNVTYRQLATNTYGYTVGAYDKSGTLIIDPTPDLAWGTYYGGTGGDVGYDVAVEGNRVYTTGYTTSATNIATSGTFQTTISSGADVYIAKFNRNGVREWGTYYGGTSNDIALAASTASNGDVVICGQTGSASGIATSGTLNPSNAGNFDGFIARFNPNGQRVWGTYYGGNNIDNVLSVSVDNNGDIAYAGFTGSTSNIAINGLRTSAIGGGDAFLGKMNSTATGVYWATYLGTDNLDEAYTVATDGFGNVFMSGIAYRPFSTQVLTTVGSHQPQHAGDSTDFFLVKFNSTGNIQWGTYYGGTAGEVRGNGEKRIATDGSGNVYLVGSTLSTNGISTIGGAPTNGDEAGFIAKFNSSGQRQWGMYQYSGAGDATYGVAVDGNNDIYTLGVTLSKNGQATNGAHQFSAAGDINLLLTKMDGTGLTDWATYYSGSDNVTFGSGITTDEVMSVYVAGYTNTTLGGHESTGAHQAAPGGGTDAVFAKFIDCSGTVFNASASPAQSCFGQNNGTVTVSTTGGTLPFTYTLTNNNTTQRTNLFTSLSPALYNFMVRDSIGCKAQASATVTQSAQINTTITGPSTATAFSNNVYTVPAQTGIIYTWSAMNGNVNSGQNTNMATIGWGASGNGEVKLVAENGQCKDSATLAVFLTPSGVNDVAAAYNIQVYPNPATDFITIKMQEATGQQITLYDNMGRIILTLAAKAEQTLSIRALPAGIYLLQVGNNWQQKIEKL